MHDLIEALRGGYGIMLAAAALYQGACRSIHSFAQWPGRAGLCCSRPCRTLSGAAAESAQYDRVKHGMCHQDASARLAPNDATRQSTRGGSGLANLPVDPAAPGVDEEVEAAAL